MKKNQFRLLTLAVLLITVFPLVAQVRIGGGEAPAPGAILDLNSTDRGGLLLSNVNITSMDSIPANATVFPGIVPGSAAADVNLSLKGMVVYNINPDTGEGLYVWNGREWKLVNGGGGSVVIKGDPGNDPACDPFKADGSCDNGYQVTDPACKEPGDFVFTWIAGESFVDRLTVIDAGAGKFSVKFLPNNRASSRNAILLVTSPCGNSNTFVFTQEGDNTGCSTSPAVPAIKSNNPSETSEMCQGGAVYLYLEGYPAGTYIWTLNGDEVGQGNTCVATKPGKYIVYGDKIGCPNSQSVTVTLGGNTAPAPVQFIVAGNSGIICTAGGTAELVVKQPIAGSSAVVWYRDGKKAVDGTDYNIKGGSWNILAKAGSWFAVVEDGNCASTPTAPLH